MDGVRFAIIFCHWLYYVPVIHSFCHSSLELGNTKRVVTVLKGHVQGGEMNRL